jgi:hypothetical protein
VGAGPPQPCSWVLDTARPYDPILGLEHPARPVDARWSAAVDRVRRGTGLGAAHTDAWVDRATRYVLALLPCQTESDRERVGREYPDLDAAFRLHADKDKLRRGLVQGRLLAGQTVEAVAAACGLTPGAVRAYESLFFEVGGKLDAGGYIVCQALGEKHLGDKTEEDVDAVLRWAGYNRGPAVLDALERYYRSGWSVPDRLDDLTREQLEELDLMVRLRALVLSYVLPAGEIRRLLVLEGLREELQRLIASWPNTPPNGVASGGNLKPSVPRVPIKAPVGTGHLTTVPAVTPPA